MITTNKPYNFSEAESEIFKWSKWDGTNGNILTHKETGREIYQMYWCTRGKQVERVTGEISEQVTKFWAELRELEAQKPPANNAIETDPEPKHGENGYCRKCHTYCYGDCQAN